MSGAQRDDPAAALSAQADLFAAPDTEAAVGAVSVRDFAERILFGAQLEAKLYDPGRLLDHEPGAALAQPPEAPGRPQLLQFRSTTRAQRVRFPSSAAALEADHARGVALHFFANHELLALELMALALLRFPDAPPAFRRGVVAALKDEQRHLRLYLARMAELGVSFGEVPVSDFFWKALHQMDSPKAFAANLSLVLEQANLDFALQYGQLMCTVGDAPTAEILQQILRDEIRHVAFGVHWFKRWADPAQPLWQSWLSSLIWPLTPARAKAETVEVAPRLKAGLDEAYIEKLRFYVHSRGRVPDVWWFDPTVEEQARSAQGSPNASVRALWRDLAPLMVPLAAREDVVLLPTLPGAEWRARCLEAAYTLPELMQAPLEAAAPWAPPKEGALQRSWGQLRPWGDGPRVRRFAQGLAQAGARWPRETCADPQRFSRRWSAALRADVWVCTEEAEVRAAIEAIAGPVRLKAIYSTAGRDQQRLEGAAEPAQWPEPVRRWLGGVFKRHGACTVEPEYDKCVDLSALFEVSSEGALRPWGLTRFETQSGGAWHRTWLGEANEGLPAPLQRFFAGDGGRAPTVEAQLWAQAHKLAQALHGIGYAGPVGMDALIARRPEGGFALVPLIEANPRYTMGHVALRLRRRLASPSVGWLQVLNRGQLVRAGLPDFEALLAQWAQLLPQTVRGEPKRLGCGVLPLADPAQAELLLPVLVAGSAAQLAAWERAAQ